MILFHATYKALMQSSVNFDARLCTMEGYLSYRSSVRWEDGSLTYPCMSEVIEVEDGVYKIME